MRAPSHRFATIAPMSGRRRTNERHCSRRRVAAFIVCLLVSAASHFASAANLPPDAKVRFDEKRRTVRSIEGKDLLASLPAVAPMAKRDPAAASVAFVAQHREAFRLTNPARELKLDSVQRDELGFQHVRFTQVFRGLEVASCEFRFHFNRDGALYMISATHIPTPQLANVRPRLDKPAAIRAVADAVAAQPGDWPATLKICAAPAGEGILAYEVAAAVGPAQAWRVFVDARTGKILQRISMIHTGRSTSP